MADADFTQRTFWDTGEPAKRCPHCGAMKPLADFYVQRKVRRGRRPGRLNSWCKVCQKEQVEAWRKNNPEAKRRHVQKAKLKILYGLSVQDYECMSQAQGGFCAICGRTETRKRKDGTTTPLHVDHDHASGRIRGLLCTVCNTVLAMARDSPAVLRAAADYLERHKEPGHP